MLKKTLAALALGSALFTAGQAMAADYKIDKEGQHAFIEFRIKHLAIAGCTAASTTSTAASPSTRRTRRPTRSR